jgi:hypothetical protein
MRLGVETPPHPEFYYNRSIAFPILRASTEQALIFSSPPPFLKDKDILFSGKPYGISRIIGV